MGWHLPLVAAASRSSVALTPKLHLENEQVAEPGHQMPAAAELQRLEPQEPWQRSPGAQHAVSYL